MSKYLLLGFIVLPLLGMGQKRPVTPVAKPRVIIKSPLRTTLTITKPCAVFYSPDAAWLKRHKAPDSKDSDEAASDIGYYLSQTRKYLDKRKIKTVDTEANTLRFVLANGSVKMVDLRNSTFGWGLILFNGRNTPREADLVEPAAAVRAVFGK